MYSKISRSLTGYGLNRTVTIQSEPKFWIFARHYIL